MKENISNLSSLNEELEYRIGFERWKNKWRSSGKYNLKAKKFIINSFKIVKRSKRTPIHIKEKQYQYLKEKTSKWSLDINKIKLNRNYIISTFKELKKEFHSFKSIDSNKKLLEKEKQNINLLIENSAKKIEFINNKKDGRINAIRKRKLEIKLAQMKTRIKDVNDFLGSESKSRKLYISDEPPLTKMGWVKLIISYAILLFWSSIILWPIIELVRLTFNNSAVNYLNSPYYNFGFNNFKILFEETQYSKWMLNTFIIASLTSLITIISTLLMGYTFSRFRFKGKKASLLSIMILQMIPTMAALTVFYVLFTLLNKSINMSPQIVLVIIYVGGGIAGNTFIMKGYMDSISLEIDEAAKIDGLSKWKIFIKIIVPLCKPMIALVALWSFIGPFGDYILPGLLLNEKKDFTLALGIRELITDAKRPFQGPFAAGSIIVALPISILFISLRKFLVGGITAGGVKG